MPGAALSQRGVFANLSGAQAIASTASPRSHYSRDSQFSNFKGRGRNGRGPQRQAAHRERRAHASGQPAAAPRERKGSLRRRARAPVRALSKGRPSSASAARIARGADACRRPRRRRVGARDRSSAELTRADADVARPRKRRGRDASAAWHSVDASAAWHAAAPRPRGHTTAKGRRLARRGADATRPHDRERRETV